MGKTAFAGPVYGAKGNLVSFGPIAGGGGSTTFFASAVVPPYETWYITEANFGQTQASSNSSTPKLIVKVKGTNGADAAFPTGNAGSAVTVTGPTSTAAWAVVGTASVTPGEYEGYAAPANSTIRIVSSGTIGLLTVNVQGYRRFIDSTRAS
jgi:hypothetical protein